MSAAADALMAIFGFERVEGSEMSKKNDGGPAFPSANKLGQIDGMTLRDYFAAKAMQAMISAEYAEKLDPLTWSLEAYELADAMIAAREPQQ